MRKSDSADTQIYIDPMTWRRLRMQDTPTMRQRHPAGMLLMLASGCLLAVAAVVLWVGSRIVMD